MSVKKFSVRASGEVNISANFKVREFQCRDGTDEVLIDVGFVKDKLQAIREHFGKTVTVTSGYRTPSYNAKVGGAKNSYHMKGQAFDIIVRDTALAEVAKYAESIGILGIIMYPKSGFVHVDSRTSRYFSNNGGTSACTTFGASRAASDNNAGAGQDTSAKQAEGYIYHIRDLQWALNRDGITDGDGNPLKEDGVWGARTASAVAKVFLSTKTYGKYTNVTSWVQCRVGAKVDGKYGDQTAEKVEVFQKNRKIGQDGAVGKTTMLELVRLYVPGASYEA